MQQMHALYMEHSDLPPHSCAQQDCLASTAEGTSIGGGLDLPLRELWKLLVLRLLNSHLFLCSHKMTQA